MEVPDRSSGYPGNCQFTMKSATARLKKEKTCATHLANLPLEDDSSFEVLDCISASEAEARETARQCAGKAAEESAVLHFEEALGLWKTIVYSLNLRFPGDRQTASAHLELGKLLFEQWEQYSAAEEALRKSLKIEIEHDPVSEERVKSTLLLGMILSESEKHNEAEELLSTVVDICNTHYPQSDDKYTASCSLSAVYWKLDKKQEATQLLTASLTDTVKSNPVSISSARAYALFGYFAQSEQRYSEAEDNYLKALSIYKTVPSSCRDIAFVSNNLGEFYKTSQRMTQAESTYREGLEVCRGLNPISASTRNLLIKLASLYAEQERYPESKKLCYEALNIDKAHFPTSEKTGDLLLLLGSLFEKLDRGLEAESKYKEAAAIYRVYSLTSTVTALEKLGLLYEKWNRIIDAYQAFATALKTLKENDFPSPDIVRLTSKLGDVSVTREAVFLYREALGMCVIPISEEIGLLSSKLGSRYQSLQYYSDAETAYKKAFEVYRTLDPVSINTGGAIMRLVHFYKATARPSKSRFFYQEAVNEYIELNPSPEALKSLMDTLISFYGNVSELNPIGQIECQIALDLYQLHDPTSPNVGMILSTLGDLNESIFNVSEAERLYRMALEQYRRCDHMGAGDMFLRLISLEYLRGSDPDMLRTIDDMVLWCRERKFRSAGRLISMAMNHYSKDVENGEVRCKELLEEYRNCNPPWKDLALVCTNLGSGFEQIQGNPHPELSYREAMLEARSLDPASKLTVQAMEQLFQFYHDRGQVQKATQIYSDVLDLCQFYDYMSCDAVFILSSLADFRGKMGYLAAAEQVWTQALELRRTYDPTSSDTTHIMWRLSQLYDNSTQDQAAESMLTQIWEANKAEDQNSFMTYKSMHDLLDFYDRTQRLKDMLEMCRVILDWRQSLDPTSPLVKKAVNDVGFAFFAYQRTAEAEEVYKEALEIYRGVDLTATIDTVWSLQNVYEQAGRYSEIETLFQTLKDVLLQEEPTSVSMTDLLVGLADFYRQRKRSKDSEETYKSALSLFQRTNATVAYKYPEVLLKLEELYEQSLQFADAEVAYGQVIVRSIDASVFDLVNVQFQKLRSVFYDQKHISKKRENGLIPRTVLF